jgi:fibronectin-binding autotransporter adhesin
MTKRSPCRRVFTLALIPTLLATSFGASAASRTYFGPNNGLWTLASNWNAPGVPLDGDDVFLGSQAPAGVINDLNVNFNGIYAANTELKSLTLNSTAINGFMVLNQTAATSAMRARVENIGTTVAKNTYNQSAGLNAFDTLNIGVSSTQNAYNFAGGVINGFATNVGVSGSGSFNHTGGSAVYKGVSFGGGPGFPPGYSPSELNLGLNAGSQGSYTLSAGSLSVESVLVAGKGSGSFSQSGGQVSMGQLEVGSDTGNGAVVVSGGNFSASFLRVGSHGSFALQGGSMSMGSSSAALVIDSGGLFSLQGGVLAQAPGAELHGGTLRLNGHSLTLSTLTGTGVVESTNGNAVLIVDYATGNFQHLPITFSGSLQNGLGVGSLSLVKAGIDPLILDGINTYTGATTVQAGVLRAGSATGFSAASSAIVNGGTLDANGLHVSFAALSGSGGTVLVPGGSLTVGSSNGSTTFAGALAGTGAFNKVGNGLMTLAGGGSFSGTINVQAGSLRVGAVDGIAKASTVNLLGLGTLLSVNAHQSLASLSGGSLTTLNFINGSQLSVGAGDADGSFRGAFVGGGSFSKDGQGSFTLGGGAADTLNANVNTGLNFNVNAGTLVLDKAAGSNAVGGALTVAGGVVALSRSHQISDGSLVQLNAGYLKLQGHDDTIGGLSGSGGTLDLAGGSLTVAQAANTSFMGTLSGSGQFIKAGAGELTLAQPGSYVGSYAATAGRLILQGSVDASQYSASGGGTLRFEGSVVALGAGSVTSSAGATVQYKDALLNNGFLRGTGQHVLMAGSSNTLNAITTFNSTTLSQDGAASFNNFSNGGKLNNNAPATISGGSNTSSGVIAVASTLTTLDFTSNGVITVASGGVLNNTQGDLVLGGGSRTSLLPGGTLSTAAGTAIELNGALLVNNGVMSGQTNVNFGSLAKGAGVFGTVNVTEGGRFSPGNSPGLATVNGFVFGAGGSYQFELSDVNGAPGLGFDYVNNLGLLQILAGSTPSTRFTLDVDTLTLANTPGQALNFDPLLAYDFVLMHSALGISGFDPARFTIDSSGFLNATAGGVFSVATRGNDLILHFAPVPEPGTVTLWLAGMALMAFRLRRARRD